VEIRKQIIILIFHQLRSRLVTLLNFMCLYTEVPNLVLVHVLYSFSSYYVGSSLILFKIFTIFFLENLQASLDNVCII
jgi:hypothetical protein